jgi:hypothetical protein
VGRVGYIPDTKIGLDAPLDSEPVSSTAQLYDAAIQA